MVSGRGVTEVQKVVLFQGMSSTERDQIINPVQGMLIWNITTATFNLFNGGVWQVLATV